MGKLVLLVLGTSKAGLLNVNAMYKCRKAVQWRAMSWERQGVPVKK
jgi:hypothetical protein